jgi:hypothetical protein
MFKRAMTAQSVQRWAMGWMIGVLGFNSWRGLGIFLFTTASGTTLGPTQPPIQWVPGAVSLGVKRQECEADHSPPSSAEVKECVELYLHSPDVLSWRGAKLKYRDNFTFTLDKYAPSYCHHFSRNIVLANVGACIGLSVSVTFLFYFEDFSLVKAPLT